MKRIFQITGVMLMAMVIGVSCEKDTDGSPQVDAGNMSSGAIKPDSAANGEVITLTGQGIGQIRSAVFSTKNVPANITSTLNTETDLIFRVPDTAYGGPQQVTFTNSEGKTLVVNFKVLAYPNVTSAFPTDFVAGTEVTLNGNNLDDVTDIVIDGTTEKPTIVSKTKKQMVIKMPASSVNRGFLKITNLTGTRVMTQEFVNVAKAQTVFSDQLDNGFQNWGWGGNFTSSPEALICGTAGMKAAFDPAGTWGGLQLGGGAINLTGYKYFSFWVKGADVDKNVQFWLNWGNQKVITVPANKWTYFKYELATNYSGVTNVDNVTFQIFDDGKTIYFDNVMFFK
ncbi:MAG TPA: IPT/TIG domain-containing protein [Phnomibacter sp.]|nr:IPT/TIG domain-containing protein [Phnomibacter sp.]